MNIEAFAAGYRAGHDGQPPAISAEVVEHELDGAEAAKPDINGHDWAWHLIGWAVGQAVAQHQLSR